MLEHHHTLWYDHREMTYTLVMWGMNGRVFYRKSGLSRDAAKEEARKQWRTK